MLIKDINGEERNCLSLSQDESYSGFVKVEYNSRRQPSQNFFEWYPLETFLINNPTLAGKFNKTPQNETSEDLGVVSEATQNTLTDRTKLWKKNSLQNIKVWISRGKGEGQVRVIAFNTRQSLTVDQPWDIIPDKTSQYVISQNIHNPQVLGNTLNTSQIKK
jgi:hypothetical protein